MQAPASEADLCKLVQAAGGPLAIHGGGTRGVQAEGAVLSTQELTGIQLYEPGALTLVAAAGTPLAEIEAALAAENQRLAFEPMDHRGLLGTQGEPTIGGVVAANVSGPRRVAAGACRDFLLGVRFVDGQGQAISNGGRVMKNVTGYDLVKLLCGSHGTLGVLSEVSLKVLPRAETAATLLLPGLDTGAAVAALSAALGSPFDVTGAAYGDLGEGPAAMIRIEGFADSVTYRAGRLADLLGRFGAVEPVTSAEQSAAIWRAVRDVAPFHGQPGDLWRISVKPGDAPGLAAQLGAEQLLFDWGGGLIWVRMAEGSDLRVRMTVPGHATLMRASADTVARLGRFHPEPEPLARISAGLRARFDPRGIFNRGLMGADAALQE